MADTVYFIGLFAWSGGDAIPTGGFRFPCARCPSRDMRAWVCRRRIDAGGNGRVDGSCPFAGPVPAEPGGFPSSEPSERCVESPSAETPSQKQTSISEAHSRVAVVCHGFVQRSADGHGETTLSTGKRHSCDLPRAILPRRERRGLSHYLVRFNRSIANWFHLNTFSH